MKKLLKKAGVFVLAGIMLTTTGCKLTPQKENEPVKEEAGDTAKTEDNKDNKEKTKLHFLIVAGESEMKGWQGIVDAFNASSDEAEIELEQLPGGWTEYVQKITALIAAGSPPDIGRIGAAFVPQFVSKGQLADLKPQIDAELNMDDYYESAFKECEKDGHIYGVPVGIYTMVMYYNKQMFDDAGIPYPSPDWNNPWTFEQYEDAATKLTSGEGANKKYGILAQNHPERSAATVFSMGGNFFDASHENPTFASQPVIDTYQMVQDMINLYKISPTPAQTKTMPVDQMFLSGKLAMFADGSWMLPAFADKPDFKFGIAPVPKGTSSTTVSFIDQYVVFENSPNKELAWKAVKSFIQADAEKIMVENNLGGIPVYRPTVEAEKENLFTMLSAEDKEVLFQSVEHSQSLPFTPNWSEQMDAAMKTIDLVTLGKMTVEEGMEKVDESIKALK